MANHIDDAKGKTLEENRELAEKEEYRIWKDIRKKMNEGQLASLPENLSEMMRLVDPESPEGIKFQSYMEGLTQKLLPGWNFDRYPIQFLVSDVGDEINAGIIAANKPAFCFFTKALLRLVEDNENKLLHVLGHELGHEVFREAVGNSLRITRPEEIMVNMPGIWWMYSNGINPQPAVDVAQDLRALEESEVAQSSNRFKPIDTVFDIAISLLDEHPTPDFDVNMLSGTVTAFRRTVGGFEDTANISIPDDMQTLFNDVKYVSPLERAKSALNPPFDEMSPHQQLAFIEAQATHIKEGFVSRRVSDILEMLESVENDVDEQSKRVGTEIVWALKESPDMFGVLYERVNTNLFGMPEFAPIEQVFGNLIKRMDAVVRSPTYEEFCRNCDIMLEEERKLAPYPLPVIDWPPVFALPGRQNIQESKPTESSSGPLLTQLRGETSQAYLARAIGVKRSIIERWEIDGITPVPNLPDMTLDDIIKELELGLGLTSRQVKELGDALKGKRPVKPIIDR